MEYLSSLYEQKRERDEQVVYWDKFKYDSPVTLNRYFDAVESSIKIKCHIERVEAENKKYGQYSQFASPFQQMGTIETPEGQKIGICKQNR
jgi:hypothetical protein